MSINVEANLTKKIARTVIFPAAVRYQNELATACTNLKALDYEFDTDTLDRITQLVKALQDSIAELAAATSGGCGDIRKCCDVVLPAMLQVRQYADELEGLVADDLWPLPTYQEMLFIK